MGVKAFVEDTFGNTTEADEKDANDLVTYGFADLRGDGSVGLHEDVPSYSDAMDLMLNVRDGRPIFL